MSAANQFDLAEVVAAAKALSEGRFRQADAHTWHMPTGSAVLMVLGADGGCGATTVALGIAEASAPARLIECCTQTQSGLVAAGYAELGEIAGWLRADREGVRLDRRADLDPFAVPAPLPVEDDETVVVDAGHDLDVVTQTPWLNGVLQRAQVVLVCRATVPGMRRLEAKLAALEALGRPAGCALVIGPARKRWPKDVAFTLGRLTRDLETDGALLTVPESSALASRGLDANPLPPELQRVGEHLARLLHLPSTSSRK